MREVKYLLRDDVAAVCLLEDGGRQIKNSCQIAMVGRTLIRPEYIGEYAAIGSFSYKNKFYKAKTDAFNKMKALGMHPGKNYVAVIDSEIEFLVTDKSLERLATYLPGRTMANYSMLLDGLSSAVLIFVRVFETKTCFPEEMLQNESALTICTLHNADGQSTSVMVENPVPVISKNQFLYMKNQILNQFKIDGTFIAGYSNTEEDKENLKTIFAVYANSNGRSNHVKNAVAQYEASGYAISDDKNYDMAQLDYDEIFNKVLEICPGMKPIINYAKDVQAARVHEYEYYLKDVHEEPEKSQKAVKRLFDMSLRSAIKLAYYKYRDDGMDLEDTFQESCIGIIMAIQKHNENVQGLFPSYLSMWMQQVIGRDMPEYMDTFYLPVHVREKLATIKKNIENHFGTVDYKTMTQEKIAELISEYGELDGNEDQPSIYARLMAPTIQIDAIELNDDKTEEIFTDHGDFEAGLIDDASMQNSICNIIKRCRNFLNNNQKKVIYYRYLDANIKTLEETGKICGLTRERIRQIESKALIILKNPSLSPLSPKEKDKSNKKDRKKRKYTRKTCKKKVSTN